MTITGRSTAYPRAVIGQYRGQETGKLTQRRDVSPPRPLPHGAREVRALPNTGAPPRWGANRASAKAIHTSSPSCTAAPLQSQEFRPVLSGNVGQDTCLRGTGRRKALTDKAPALIKSSRTDGSCGALASSCRHRNLTAASWKSYITFTQHAHQSTRSQQPPFAGHQEFQRDDQDSQRRCSCHRRCFWREFHPLSSRVR